MIKLYKSETAITLNNGLIMPRLGFGTWKIEDDNEAEAAVLMALETGYRLIDTASRYDNEKGVGRGIKKSSVPREDIFVTTKLWPTDFGRAESAFEESLEKLGLDYVDLYLVHWPVPLMSAKIWDAMIKIYNSGKVKAIGVSNYSSKQIDRILDSYPIPPAVNQVEFNPFDKDLKLLEYCLNNNIALEAYSPLTRGENLHDEILIGIASKYNKTSAQLLIRWALQKGTIVIPKSSNPERIKENFQVFDFEILDEDMRAIDGLSE